MKHSPRQQGQSLGSLLVGLIIGIGVVGAAMWFFTHARSPFKSAKSDKSVQAASKAVTKPAPEVLQPQLQTSSQAPSQAQTPSRAESASGVMGPIAIDATPPKNETPETPAKPASTVVAVVPAPKTEPETVPTAPARSQHPNRADGKAVVTPSHAVKPKKTVQAASAPKTHEKNHHEAKRAPTPEEILNSGSVEKARQNLSRQKASQPASQPKSKAHAEPSHAKAAGKAASAPSAAQKKSVLQAGSYADERAAQAQMARLALSGVPGRIQKSTVSGKTVYRVRTGAMSAERARILQERLQQNGVRAIAIPSE